MNITQLMNLNPEAAPYDDLLLARAAFRTLEAEYLADKQVLPAVIANKRNAIAQAIVELNQANLELRLRNAKALRAAMATPEEKGAREQAKRDELDATIVELEKQLGGAPAPVQA